MELVNEQALAAVKESNNQKQGKIAVLSSPRQFDYKKFELEALKENEILVRMEGCGLCASTIPVWQGREWFNYPMDPGTPGHEGWGIVEDTGSAVKNIKKGQRVSLLAGNAFASHVICDAGKAVVLPAELDDKPFPGEPLGCAFNIFERSEVKSGQTIAILGIGFLGALLIQLAKKKGAHVIAVSRRKSSLQLAEDMGADACFSWDQQDEIYQHLNTLGKEGCERVIECVGKQKALELASHLIGTRGRLIIAGYHQEDLRHINMQIWNWKGIDVINAHERDEEIYKEGIGKAASAVAQDEIDFLPLLTHEYSFDQLNEAMETLENYPDGFTKAYINYK